MYMCLVCTGQLDLIQSDANEAIWGTYLWLTQLRLIKF